MSDGFNLLDEPWIVVLTSNGDEKQVSILELFENASELVTIGGEVPTQGFAITRLLLAFLHRALDGPKDNDEWAQLWKSESLPSGPVHRYANDVRRSFDLFDQERPFFQVAGLRTARDEFSGLEKIVADMPNGVPLFTTRSAASLKRIEPAEAARWLVHAQAFDPAGIRTGVVGASDVKNGKAYGCNLSWSGQIGGILVQGATIRETLLLNLVTREAEKYVTVGDPRDLPPWERPCDGPEWHDERRVYGAVELYTWQTRRIRLIGNSKGVLGVILAKGDKINCVNMHSVEPGTAWRDSQFGKKSSTPSYLPIVHRSERSFWRGLSALLPSLFSRRNTVGRGQRFLPPGVLQWIGELSLEGHLPESYVPMTRAIGFEYRPRDSRSEYRDLIDDALALPVGLLQERNIALGRTAEGAVDDAEKVAGALWRFAENLAQAAGAEPKSGAGDRAREALYAELDQPYRAWLSRLRPGVDPDVARRAWQSTVRLACRPVIDELLDTAGPAAWRGREINGRLVNVAIAETWFHASLRKILPLAFTSLDEPARASATNETETGAML